MWQRDYKGKPSLSLAQFIIPTHFKMFTIVPLPKNTKVICLNDYCPVSLKSVAIQFFERLVMAHINTIIPDTLDPLQFSQQMTMPFPTWIKKTPT
jgi:hypothetical protein